jgi:hypothetical protein
VEETVREAPPNVPHVQVDEGKGDIDRSPSASIQASSCA